MYEDEPQDRVHDVLAEAIYGDHPLGRRVLGRAEVIAGVRCRTSPSTTGPATPPTTSSSPQPVTSSTPTSWSSPSGCWRRRSRPRGRSAGQRRLRTGAPSLLRKGDRAVPHLLRGSRDPARRRSPLHPRDSRHRLRRLGVLASVPGGPREARPRLLGRFVHGRVHRSRLRRDVRRYSRGQRRRGLRDHRSRARRRPQRGDRCRRACPCQGARQGPDGPRPRGHRIADESPRSRDPLRRAGALAGRDARARGRGDWRRGRRTRRRAL